MSKALERLSDPFSIENEEDRAQPRDKLGRFGSSSSTDKEDDDSFVGEMDAFFAEQEAAADAAMGITDIQADYVEGLDTEAVAVLSDYAGEGSSAVNKQSRGAPPPPLKGDAAMEAEYNAEVIEDAISAAPSITAPVIVYRGLDLEAAVKMDRAAIGSTVIDRGFASTSTSQTAAGEFARGGSPMLRITLLPGASALSMHPFSKYDNELEVLIQRGTNYKITGKSGDFIDLEVGGK